MKKTSVENCIKYLKNITQRLAMSYDEQNANIEEFAKWNLPSDLATDWENYDYFVNILFEANIIGKEMVAKFKSIDSNFLEATEEDVIWEHEGLKDHPFWKKQRVLASALLDDLAKL